MYANGQIPESALIIFKRGHNSVDGDWYHGLLPNTFKRHCMLVRIARERTGRTLEITDGFGAYRPLWAQEIARRIYGYGAAEPGWSSHGGFWEGRDTQAMDYGNWAWVYEQYGDRAREIFFYDCRRAGLTPGMIHPSRGNNYPDEPWHVIDLFPGTDPNFPEEKVEDEMTVTDLYSEVKKSTLQTIKPGKREYVHFDNAGSVTVASGESKHVDGVLTLAISTDVKKAPEKRYHAVIHVTPLIETVVDNKTVASVSLGTQEVIVTDGNTLCKVPVSAAMGKNQRLRFKVSCAEGGLPLTIQNHSTFRGMRIT